MTIKELMEKNEWTRKSPSLRDGAGKHLNTCQVCCSPEEHGVHDPECWLGLVLKLLRAQPADFKLHIGWYYPGGQRFCYTDVKEAAPEHHKRYTVPVFAHLDSSILEGRMDDASEAIFQLRLRMRTTLEWMVTDLKMKHNETHGNVEPGSEGGYTPALTEAINFLEELQQ